MPEWQDQNHIGAVLGCASVSDGDQGATEDRHCLCMTPEKSRRGSAGEGSPLSSPLRYAQGLKSRGSFFGLIAFGVTTTVLVALYLLVIGKKDHLSACWLYENDIDGSCAQVMHLNLQPC